MALFDRIANLFASKKETRPAVPPGRNEPCWCGSGKKYKKCHQPVDGEKAAEKACSLHCGPG